MHAGEPLTGEIKVGISAVQLPSVPGFLVKIKARSTNTNTVFVGNSSVTTPKGNTNDTTGYGLTAGQDTGWIPCDNLNKFYAVSDVADQGLTYLVMHK